MTSEFHADQGLTDHEAELYDRQIRLWGYDAQKKLHASKVLLIGLKGLGCDVAKNVILAGIKSITILDHNLLTEEDTESQFLAPPDQVGKNRAEASVERAQQLNAMVNVVADSSNIKDKPDSYFGEFDVVFASQCSIEELIRIDHACRKLKVNFFCGDVFGMFGFMFSDLNVHDYTVETTKNVGGVSEKTTSKHTSSFVSLKDGLDVDWKEEGNAKFATKMEPSYMLMKSLLRFRGEHGRNLRRDTRGEDKELLREMWAKEVMQSGLDFPVDQVPEALMVQLSGEVSPVCGVLGGIAGWEIFKALTHKDEPHNNFFFFDPIKCTGSFCCIGNKK